MPGQLDGKTWRAALQRLQQRGFWKSMALFFALIGASYFFYVLRTLRAGPDFASPIPPVQLPAGMQPGVEAS